MSLRTIASLYPDGEYTSPSLIKGHIVKQSGALWDTKNGIYVEPIFLLISNRNTENLRVRALPRELESFDDWELVK